jgi:predicted nicotinamide N-methyase
MMRDQQQAPEMLDLSAFPADVRTLLERIARSGQTVVVQDHGRDLMALVSLADLERLRSLDRLRRERFSVVEEVHRRNQHLDPEEVERDIAEEIATMRAEDRARPAV